MQLYTLAYSLADAVHPTVLFNIKQKKISINNIKLMEASIFKYPAKAPTKLITRSD